MNKPFLLSIILSLFSSITMGQTQNQLNHFLLESVQDYIHFDNQFLNRIQRNDTIEYLCIDCLGGLPKNFPYDSLYLKTLSISPENNPITTKKSLKRFVKTIRVSYSLEDNVIDIIISKCNIRRPRRSRMQIEVDGDSASHYYYEYNCETNRWEQVIKCIYSDVITKSFVCIQNDSISIYLNPPHLDKPSFFYGTYKCSNDTLFLHDNLLKNSMKPNEYLFVLDSAHQTLSIMPQPSTINDTTPNNPTNKRKMLLGHRFKNTSCFEELKKVW